VIQLSPTQSNRPVARSWALVCALLLLMLPSHSHAADVVVVRASGAPTWQMKQLEVAAQFYGLNLRPVVVGGAGAAQALQLVRQPQTLALAIEADALHSLDRRTVLAAIRRPSGRDLPLLLFGFSPGSDPALLSAWSGGAVLGTTLLAGQGRLEYLVAERSGIAQQLSGATLPFAAESAWRFVLNSSGQDSTLLSLRGVHGVYPVFIRTDVNHQSIFLLSGTAPGVADAQWNAPDAVGAFAAVAPMMMFLKYAAGDRGWHTPQYFANFTIDDPWLREPYGHLDYKGLLAEMDRHNFHTTIAFIPWNYDRSEPGMVALFRSRPDRYSISVHGDNHDHKEFEGFNDKSLALQTSKLKQALARMNEFQKLTGIPYDRTFVFPHSIGMASVFGALESYNYTATFNSTNVPMDGPRPQGPLFFLRPVTTMFCGFPSVQRMPPVMPNRAAFIAVQQFLGNPLLFYAHQDFFAAGIGAFDAVADEVNRSEPATQWHSLGDIAAHLYLLRQTGNSAYDVFTYGSNIRLENSSSANRTYSLSKDEQNPVQIGSVTIDGQPAPYEVRNGLLRMAVTVPAGQSRSVAILYRNDLKTAPADIARRSVRVYLLRTASDFRDIWLSRVGVGEAATALYYRHNGTPARVLALAVLLVVPVAGGAWALLVTLRKRTARRQRSKNRDSQLTRC
jgi:hypothetical protein